MRFLLSILLCFSFLSVLAQDWEEGEIESTEIIVEKDRQITLPPANRYFEKVKPTPIPPAEPIQKYTFKNFDYTPPTTPPKIRVLRLKKDYISKLYGNYIKAGFGSYTTPYLEGYFNNKRNKSSSYGAHLKHFNALRGPVDKQNSGQNETLAEVFGNYFTKNLTLEGNLKYIRDKHYFYGYDRTIEVARDTIKQVFNQFHLGLSLKSNTSILSYSYSISPYYHYFRDAYSARENLVGIPYEFNYKIKENKIKLQIKGEAAYAHLRDSSKISRGVFEFKPLLYYQVSSALSIRGGANIVYENDTINTSSLHFYPIFRADYTINNTYTAYAGITGGIQKNFLSSFANENPYLSANVPVYHTLEPFAIIGGIKGYTYKNVAFDVGVRVSGYRNTAYYVNGLTDSTRFDIVYDQGFSQRINFYGSLTYEMSHVFNLRLRGDYFGYRTDDVPEPWHRPRYQLSITGHYNLYNKFLFEAQINALGGIRGYNLQSNISQPLKAIVDIDFKVNYIFSKRFSTFLLIDNALAQANEYYWHYPSRRVFIMAGISYSF